MPGPEGSIVKLLVLVLVLAGLNAGPLNGWAASRPGTAGGGPATTAPPAMPQADRIRIAEAYRLADALGDRIWPGWSGAPRAVLLVTARTEYVVRHPRPTLEFSPAGYDSLLESTVYVRDRVFGLHLLASFPAVAGVPTVVIGQPRHTDAGHSTRWVLTLLHEHLHQWQQSQPDYYTAVDRLDLARGDSTGMWMLNYPFPYDSKAAGGAFRVLCDRLREGVTGGGNGRGRLAAYLEARDAFEARIGAADRRYFAFQLWQEGIARYTEVRLAALAAVAYTPAADFLELPDVRSFEDDARETRSDIISRLGRLSLAEDRRSAFYVVGAAEGLYLDRVAPGWQRRYMTEKFATRDYFPARER